MAEQQPDGPRRQFVHFLFYKLDPAWRRLPQEEREAGKQAFEQVVEKWVNDGLIVVPYTLMGIRGEADMMLWRIASELEPLQQMGTELAATPLGSWLDTPYGYISQTKRSHYVDKIDPEHDEQRLTIQPGRYKYNFVYPFVKTREWYQMARQARQGVMDEHIEVGNRFPSVKLNTTYSFGFDDQEFMLAFETNEPNDFLDLVMALRETEGSRFTERDTPIFTCLRTTVRGMLDSLGG